MVRDRKEIVLAVKFRCSSVDFRWKSGPQISMQEPVYIPARSNEGE